MKHYYFADYEVQIGGALMRWGNCTLEYEVAHGREFDPDAVLQQLRDQAADKYGVLGSDVRLRNVCRL